MLHPASLLGDAQQVKRLTPLQRRLPVQLVLGQGRGALHKRLGCPHSTPVALDQRGRQARRDAKETEEKKGADGAMLVAEAFREHDLRDEAQLEVVARELVDGLDDLGQRGKELPLIGGAVGDAGGHGEVRAHHGRRGVEAVAAELGAILLPGLVGPQARVAVLAVLVRLAADGEDAAMVSDGTLAER